MLLTLLLYLLYFVLSIVLLIAAYVIYMCWHFNLFTRQGIPTEEKPVPVLGNSLKIMKEGFINGIQGNIEKYGKTHGSFSSRRPVLYTIEPDIIKEVFIKRPADFPNRFGFSTGDPLDDSMLNNITDYAHWKAVRSTMSPTFSTGKLRNMIAQINKCARVYAGHLFADSSDGKSLEMKEYAGSFTMDAIASTAFGIDVNAQEDPQNPFVLHAKSAFTVSLGNPLMIIGLFFPFLQPLLRCFKVSFFKKECKDFFTDITNQALDGRREDKDQNRVDFLQLMMKSHLEEGTEKYALTKDELLSQAFLFFLAGYDTTATSIGFLAYNLACNQDKQEKLITEINDVLQDKERDVTDEDLSNMPYLEMCVEESLRMFPPVMRVDRVPAKDVEVRGMHLPKGSLIVVPVYHMHHFEEYYPNPSEFIPERFSKEERKKIDNVLYMPFGSGPRMCIGSRLALLEIKLAIVQVLKSHRFVRAPETQVPMEFNKRGGLLKAENGVWLGLVKHADYKE